VEVELNLKRFPGLVLVFGLLFPAAACDDVTNPAPPPPGPQITVETYYTATVDSGVQTGLQNNDVYDIFEASSDQVWIGNQDGVAVFGLGAGPRSILSFNDNNGLPNPKVRTIVELDGKLYLGTWGGGIGVYDLALKTWSSLTTADGLVNDAVADIQVHGGKLYVATNGGVSMYDPAARPGEEWDSFVRTPGDETGDLLDEYVSAIAIAETPRGKEHWYLPRWESAVEPGAGDQHGITVARGTFNAAPVVTLYAERDNTMYEDPDGAISNGSGRFMFSGLGTDGVQRRALVKFDLGDEIPPGATILEAGLRLYCSTDVADLSRMILYRATSDWGEGTSTADGDEMAGAPSTTGDATWKHTFYPTSEWANPGGDYESLASASTVVTTQGSYQWQRPGTAADVQLWLDDPSSNHGWVLDSPESVKRWHTRENGDVDRRPVLQVRHGGSTVIYLTEATSDLPEPNVNDVLYDESTDLYWLAFSTQGLATVSVESATWTFYDAEDGLPSNVVYSITEVDGVIWIGTQRGLARHRGNGTFQGYDRGAGLPADRVRKVYSDAPGRLWLGFVDAGAAQVDATSAR
jgi:hypothetical protein